MDCGLGDGLATTTAALATIAVGLFITPIFVEAHLRTDGWPVGFIAEAQSHILETWAAARSAPPPG